MAARRGGRLSPWGRGVQSRGRASRLNWLTAARFSTAVCCEASRKALDRSGSRARGTVTTFGQQISRDG
jgi:hypothetical protein